MTKECIGTPKDYARGIEGYLVGRFRLFRAFKGLIKAYGV